MSLARGKFGVEYNPRRVRPESSGFGWVFVAVALAALVSFGYTVVRRIRAHREETVLAQAVVETPERASPAVQIVTSRNESAFQPLNADLAHRAPRLRTLLMRLDEAERQLRGPLSGDELKRNLEMAVTTIETIRAIPGSPAADIDDSLARRLGALNVRRLFDLRNAQWVKQVTVRRGDSASRLAAENGSTLSSFARLNGGSVDRIVVGKSLYVMNHPRFNLVIHRRTRTADLALNGKFFKRYDLTGAVRAKEGAYEMPERRRAFWGGVFGQLFASEDRAEIDMLMPNGSPVLVSEM